MGMGMDGSIILIGMMGAGKTAVGHELARMLHRPFRDSDTAIERAAAMSIPEIFARDGEAFFRDREAEVIARLLDGPPIVLSVGGGAWVQSANRTTIRAAGISVWIDPPLEVLWQRVRQRAGRPLLATADPRGTLETLLEKRRPVYAKADVTVPVAAPDTVETTARAVIAAIAAARPGYLP